MSDSGADPAGRDGHHYHTTRSIPDNLFKLFSFLTLILAGPCPSHLQDTFELSGIDVGQH